MKKSPTPHEQRKVALVGCGRIGFLLESDPLRYKPCTHLGALRYLATRDKKIEFVAFCDSDLERATAAECFARASNSLVTPDAQAAIDLMPDLLVIAANTAAHYAILKAAITAKIPRIVIEKPVAFSAREAQKLRKLVQKSQSIVMPNYERRYHPKYRKLWQALHEGKSPKASSYRGFFAAGGKSLYADAKTGDEGVLLHDTTHLLDLAQYFFGRIRRHRTLGNRRRHLLWLEHASGATGVIETALGVGAFHLELEIHTRTERITVGNGFLERERIRPSPHYSALKAYGAPVRMLDKKFSVSQNPF
ncbi:MAG: Gfo/Idh/MocA family oxidoreductase, partial [Spirochaetes bacterium]|nr:Gfo/Idh/MocA family oxidoreductase [Spirochaetota bacterium]